MLTRSLLDLVQTNLDLAAYFVQEVKIKFPALILGE